MRRVASGFSPVIAVDRNAAKPLHRQIYDAYRNAIVARNLRPNEQVPSTRALAVELGISRLPVLDAYAQLLSEGYFETRAGAGTFVCRFLPEQLTSCERPQRKTNSLAGARVISRRSALIPKYDPAPWIYGQGAFNVGQVASEHFPAKVWANLIARHTRSASARALHFSDPMGSEHFRKTIADYLGTARAVNCDEKQIMVVSGSQQALEISARVLLDPGNPVWIEEPGYRLTRNVLTLAGCRLIPVPVDKEGLDVASGIKRCAKARAAFVTPSHQFPLGATMSASRRLQLLDWAQSARAWIIEDDYDSEYRYSGMPIASLQGLDQNSRVIYIGTFSKTLFPSLRVGYMVIPMDLVDRFAAVRLAMDVYPPHLYQAVLADFICEGHLARHIRRTRLLYQQRRNILVDALRSTFGSRISVPGEDAGMHLVVEMANGVSDIDLAVRAARSGLWMWPLSPHYIGKDSRRGLVLGFGNVRENVIPKAVRQLRGILGEMK